MVNPLIRASHRLFSAFVAIAALPALPATAMFQRIETNRPTPCDHQLTRIQDIPYQCWKFEDPNAKLPVWKDSLGFEFGKLTQAQWEKIAIAYASWRSTEPILEANILPAYDPEKRYWLMDFMPPIMQATNRHRFISQSVAATPDATSITANCWGTVYEILRLRQASAQQQAYLMMVDPHTILTTLESLSTPVKSPQPGDTLLISHDHVTPHAQSAHQSGQGQPSEVTYLDHAALFIDQGLVFEKAGAGDHVPYRLVGLSTVQRVWRKDVFDHQIRRPIAHQAMPYPLSFRVKSVEPPTTLIADHDPVNPSEQYYSIFPLPPLIEPQGTPKLPPKLLKPDYYRRYLKRINSAYEGGV